MTNKTIPLSRELVAEAAIMLKQTGTDDALAEDLRAALAAPVPPACCKCGKPTACGKMICEECCYEPLPVAPAGDWAINTTAGRPILVYQECSVIEAEQAYYVLGLINGTVPPAGGGVVALIDQLDDYIARINGDDRGSSATVNELRVHVTQLQAEVERLEEQACISGKNMLDQWNRANALQSELTKARELIGDLRADTQSGYLKAVQALHNWANQSAPADKGQGEECTSCDGSGEYTDAIGDWRGYCSCPAGAALKKRAAPVAAVMPYPVSTQDFGDESMANGWNACLDELARLNSEPKP